MSTNHGNLSKLRHNKMYAQSIIQGLKDQIEVRKKYNSPTKELEIELRQAEADLRKIEKEIEKRREK